MAEIIAEGRTLMSMEVAEMVGKEHHKLIRDIKRYSNQLAESKIGLGDLWNEQIYTDKNNQSRPCYSITPKGCEFIAHKMTGTKGCEFTAKYINRFHEMEEELKKSQPALEKKAPQKSNWYEENKDLLSAVCEIQGIQLKELYSNILKEVAKKYDVEACRVIYEKENGYPPSYAIDIVPYFDDIKKSVCIYLEGIVLIYVSRYMDVLSLKPLLI